jgi:uncharacterized integral membrane protein
VLIRLRLLLISFGGGLLLMLLLCLGAQNLQDRHTLQLGGQRSVPLPTGFLVGIALVIGVISGGTATGRVASRTTRSLRLRAISSGNQASNAIKVPSTTKRVMPRASRKLLVR